MRGNRSSKRALFWVAVALAALLALAACNTTDDVDSAVTDTLKSAFQTVPDALFNHDLSAFKVYVATPEQGADAQGLQNLYQWLEDFQSAGTLPEEEVHYDLTTLAVQNIQSQGQSATAHIHAELSKIGAGDQADVAIAVDQNIALQKTSAGKWLIVGADQAQVKDLTQPVK